MANQDTLPPRTLLSTVPVDAHQGHLAAMVESSQDAVISQDLHGTVLSWNAGAEAIFGFRAHDMIGAPITRLIPAHLQHEEYEALEQLRRGERVERLDTQRQTQDGRLIDVSVTISPIRDAYGRIVGASKFARDITARKQIEHEKARLARLYAALSQINQAIVWTPQRDSLFRRICQVLVEQGGLCMAWVGWRNSHTGQLEPVAMWGDRHGYLRHPEAAVDAGADLNCPQVCNDLLAQTASHARHHELTRSGFLAAATFPIRSQGVACGLLGVYAERRDFFQDSEITLLTEAATDVSFALDNFAREEARRQAEHTLRSETQFSSTMLESLPGIVYFYDTAGRFLRWNHNFEVVSGYSGAEIATMHPRDFFTPADQVHVEARIAEVFARGESSVEAPFLSRDGRTTPYFFTGRRVVFQEKVCLVGVGIDISERKRAEAALREAELRYQTLFEQTPVGVAVVDPTTATIVECNAQAAQQLGYTRQELAGRAVAEIEAKDSQTEIDQRLGRLRGLIHGHFETQHRTRTGEIRDVFVSGHLIELSGRQLIHCVFLDITERLRMEAEREKLHRAEAADRIKSSFLATMSHELRTPLNGIIGFTGIMAQGLAGPLTDEQRRQLGMVQSSAQHLLALVNDVLDISKIESGQMDMAHQRFDLPQSLQRVVAAFAPQVQSKGLTLHTHIADHLGQAVGDQRRFEQILLNLLANAVKFTDQGHITLTADLPARLPGQPVVVRVQVSDSGIGIKPEDLPQLFQPFRQLDASLSRRHEGTGLGLAICQRLAHLMGGDILVESQWGIGSTFSLLLPLQAPVPAT